MSESTFQYLCEFRKKWSFTVKEGSSNTTVKCTCGRIIVVDNGIAYSTGRPNEERRED